MATTINITVSGEELSLGDIMEKLEQMEQAIQELRDAVAQNSSVTASAATLIQGLADQLEAAAGDEAAVQSLAGDIRSAADQLAAAVAENTEPETPEEPTPPEV